MSDPSWETVVISAGTEVAKALVTWLLAGLADESFWDLAPCEVVSWARSNAGYVLTTRRLLLERDGSGWVFKTSFSCAHRGVSVVKIESTNLSGSIKGDNILISLPRCS
jgi:hypothetical protein